MPLRYLKNYFVAPCISQQPHVAFYNQRNTENNIDAIPHLVFTFSNHSDRHSSLLPRHAQNLLQTFLCCRPVHTLRHTTVR